MAAPQTPIQGLLDLLNKANLSGNPHKVDADQMIGALIRAVLQLDGRLSAVEIKTSLMM